MDNISKFSPAPKAAAITNPIECTFEVVLRLPPGLPRDASPLAHRALIISMDTMNKRMMQAYGESFDVVSIAEIMEDGSRVTREGLEPENQ